MAFVFRRELTIPPWAIAFVALALAAPTHPMPPVTILLGIAVLVLTTTAMVRWRRASRPPIEVLPAMGPDTSCYLSPSTTNRLAMRRSVE